MISSGSHSLGHSTRPPDASTLNDVVDRFEDAWELGERPVIDHFLADAASPAVRLTWLVELIHVELERRLAHGEDASVQEYLLRYPKLADETAWVVDLVTAEHGLRRRRGESLRWEEFVNRFPQFTERLLAVRRVGRFELVEQLGAGGFGTVWKAFDAQLHRPVAIKVLHATRLDSAADRERFYREGRSAAILQHPGIVAVHEVGVHEERPYLVCEYVAGVTLATALAQRQIEVREAVQIALDVAVALDYAHARGIVHRDIKPANIMLSAVGSSTGSELTSARIMDFGLAQRADVDVTLTSVGQMVGTPAYMSPEQATGAVNKVDGRTDLFSVGVVLYQMLTGSLPYQPQVTAVLPGVLHIDPPPLRRRNPLVPRDLEAVCLKCLEKDPQDRYATAADLANDLRRWLNGQPTVVRPLGPVKQVIRWIRRHPQSAMLMGVCLTLSAAMLMINQRRVHDLRIWTAEAQRLRRAAAADHRESDAIRAMTQQRNYNSQIRLARELQQSHQLPRLNSLLTNWRSNAAEALPPTFELSFLSRIAAADQVVYAGQSGPVFTAAFSPDQALLLAGTERGQLLVVDHRSRHLVATIAAHDYCINSLVFSPDGQQFATASCDGTVKLWNSRELTLTATLYDGDAEVFDCAYNHDGSRLATAHGNGPASVPGRIDFWDLATRRLLPGTWQTPGDVTMLEHSPDGKYVAAASTDGTFGLWDWDGRLLQALHTAEVDRVTTLRFAPDSASLAVNRGSVDVQLLRIPDLSLIRGLGQQPTSVQSLAFSPAGDRLAVARTDGTLCLAPLDSAAAPTELVRTHLGAIWDIKFSSDGAALHGCLNGGSLRRWYPEQLVESRLIDPAAPPAWQYVFTRDGRQLTAVDAHSQRHVWQLDGGVDSRTVSTATEPAVSSPAEIEKSWAPATWMFGTAYEQDADGEWRQHHVNALSPNGDRITEVWVRGTNCQVEVWKADRSRLLSTRQFGDVPLNVIAVSPRGRLAVFGDPRGENQLWSLDDGRKLLSLSMPAREITAAAISADESMLVAAGPGGAKLVETRTGRVISQLAWVGGRTEAICFSPDGRRIVIGDYGNDHALHVFETTTGEELLQLNGHREPVRRVMFSPSGQDLVSVGWNNHSVGPLRLWAGLKDGSVSPD